MSSKAGSSAKESHASSTKDGRDGSARRVHLSVLESCQKLMATPPQHTLAEKAAAAASLVPRAAGDILLAALGSDDASTAPLSLESGLGAGGIGMALIDGWPSEVPSLPPEVVEWRSCRRRQGPCRHSLHVRSAVG